MKRIVSVFSMLVVALMLVGNVSVVNAADKADKKAKKEKKVKKAAKEDVSTALGYKIEGNDITFTFNVKDYASFDAIESVTVAGEFNGWDPAAADWQATDEDKDGIWIFKTTLDKAPVGSKFKFVSNEVDWQQPLMDKVDKKYLADDGFGGFNLTILAE